MGKKLTNKQRLDWLIKDTKKRIKNETDDFNRANLEDLLDEYMEQLYEEIGFEVL